MIPSDSKELMQKAAAGDEDAATRLLEHYGPEVERTLQIARKWRSVLEPADVMQVTYIEAFLQISRFDPNRSETFVAWLRRIAENNLRDAIRGLQCSKRPQPQNRVVPNANGDGFSELFALLGVATTTPSRDAGHSERQDRLYAILDTLPEDYGRVIRLYDLENQSVENVSRQMKRSPGAVHMLRVRAHDRLRQVVGTESAWFSSFA